MFGRAGGNVFESCDVIAVGCGLEMCGGTGSGIVVKMCLGTAGGCWLEMSGGHQVVLG